MKKPKISRTELIIIAVIILLAAAFTGYGLINRNKSAELPDTAEIAAELELTEEESAQLDVLRQFAEDKAAEYLASKPAESYLVVTLDSQSSMPLPLNGDDTLTVTQEDGSTNTIRIGKNSFVMESSNCDNQNCVGQGEVTLENKDSRVLFDMILCLPHRLTLEMKTPEEAQAALTELYIQQLLMKAAEGVSP